MQDGAMQGLEVDGKEKNLEGLDSATRDEDPHLV